MSAVSEYSELLKLIEVSGPFLSLPVFKKTFPQGLAKDSPALVREMRELYLEWCVARSSMPTLISPAQREWLSAVFHTLLGWPSGWVVQDNAIPQNLYYAVAQHHEILHPDAVLLESSKPRLLIAILPPNQQPDRRPLSSTWNASWATRMAELLHATRVPMGLVTNGERFTIVYAEPGQPTGLADFRAELWFDERLTLRAFRDFLSADALFNRPPEESIEGLYRQSLQNQQDVSITLGRQVRRAVEVFVSALDGADRESGRSLLTGVQEEHIYEAALFVMMRLVFLFFAEERDLLPVTNAVYRENYAVSTLFDQLRESADNLGEEVLERRYDAFPRLLATFRAVHDGVQHDLMALPAYGGDLFDPDKFPFLEGRTENSNWHEAEARPCPIHNRTVLHLLEALQFLEIKVSGREREKRRLSFRALDIEQIGHVYEGLLDHTVRRATEILLSLEGKEALDVPLSEVVRRSEQPGFVEWLADETGRTARAIQKMLSDSSVDDPVRGLEWQLVGRFSALARRDDNGGPCIVPAGSLYVTAGVTRRQTGTQYTPRTLTESVVEHALSPQVYVGPAEGLPPEQWQLKSAADILELKVCDFACGSAAFLVAAARYLSVRLVEAWENAQRDHGAGVQITPYGDRSTGLLDEELIPENPEERGLYALRLVVERCLYGVDRNSLAVEMAKLSLWLLTLQRNKPFTFLDHAIRCGDSLLGVDLKQLSTWSLSGDGKQTLLFNDDLNFAASKREGLMKMQYRPGDQRRLLEAALFKTRRIRAAADRLIATAFETNPEASVAAISIGLEAQETEAQEILKGKHPFHWSVEFPEVFLHGGGFDAIVGNPPFMGGQRITGVLSRPYRDYLVQYIAGGRRGSADYVAYFFLRAQALLKDGGTAGLLATNTIAQGGTREVGLDQMTTQETTIYRALPSRKWPGEASLEIAHIWFRKGSWAGTIALDDAPVVAITSQLQAPGRVTGRPFRLASAAGKSFQGSIVLGMGFVLQSDDARRLIEKDPRNRDVLSPYLNGEDLNSQWDQSPSRWVINFRDFPVERAMEYPSCFEIVERLVKPERDRLAKGDETARDRARRWWQFARPTRNLYGAIAGFERVLVVSLVTQHVAMAFVPGHFVFAHKLAVFVFSNPASLGLLQSNFHEPWARNYSSSLESRINYSPSDCFETFPFPTSLGPLESIGYRYDSHRRGIMAARREGLTVIYNRFHSSHEVSTDIAVLREFQVEMDYVVAAAYGWADIDLAHGFHETRQGVRYTISERARREVLDRLLALNHERHAEEQSGPVLVPNRKMNLQRRDSAEPTLF
jgi:hypothetical protein